MLNKRSPDAVFRKRLNSNGDSFKRDLSENDNKINLDRLIRTEVLSQRYSPKVNMNKRGPLQAKNMFSDTSKNIIAIEEANVLSKAEVVISNFELKSIGKEDNSKIKSKKKLVNKKQHDFSNKKPAGRYGGHINKVATVKLPTIEENSSQKTESDPSKSENHDSDGSGDMIPHNIKSTPPKSLFLPDIHLKNDSKGQVIDSDSDSDSMKALKKVKNKPSKSTSDSGTFLSHREIYSDSSEDIEDSLEISSKDITDMDHSNQLKFTQFLKKTLVEVPSTEDFVIITPKPRKKDHIVEENKEIMKQSLETQYFNESLDNSMRQKKMLDTPKNFLPSVSKSSISKSYHFDRKSNKTIIEKTVTPKENRHNTRWSHREISKQDHNRSKDHHEYQLDSLKSSQMETEIMVSSKSNEASLDKKLSSPELRGSSSLDNKSKELRDSNIMNGDYIAEDIDLTPDDSLDAAIMSVKNSKNSKKGSTSIFRPKSAVSNEALFPTKNSGTFSFKIKSRPISALYSFSISNSSQVSLKGSFSSQTTNNNATAKDSLEIKTNQLSSQVSHGLESLTSTTIHNTVTTSTSNYRPSSAELVQEKPHSPKETAKNRPPSVLSSIKKRTSLLGLINELEEEFLGHYSDLPPLVLNRDFSSIPKAKATRQNSYRDSIIMDSLENLKNYEEIPILREAIKQEILSSSDLAQHFGSLRTPCKPLLMSEKNIDSSMLPKNTLHLDENNIHKNQSKNIITSRVSAELEDSLDNINPDTKSQEPSYSTKKRESFNVDEMPTVLSGYSFSKDENLMDDSFNRRDTETDSAVDDSNKTYISDGTFSNTMTQNTFSVNCSLLKSLADLVYTKPLKSKKYLGGGAEAKVYAVRMPDSLEEVALKQYEIMKEDKDQASFIALKKEFRLFKKLNHPNIVRYFSIYSPKRGHCANSTIYGIIMEYMAGGSLESYINQNNYKITLTHKKSMIKQILLGLDHLHQNNIIHRDLKPANILLSEDYKTLKITDFGISIETRNHNSIKRTMIGTPWYMAPEVIQQEASSNKADIWSVGCCFYHLITGNKPYNQASAIQALMMMVHHKSPLEVCNEEEKNTINAHPHLWSFLSSCLMREKSKRATLSQLLKHPFLQDVLVPYDNILETTI